MNDHVTVYSKPGCYQCKASIRAFAKNDIAVTVVDVSANAEAAEHLDALGYCSVPVIITSTGERWSGHRPDRIAAAFPVAATA